MFHWGVLNRPIIGLAPMADMTDTPFNRICKQFGVPVIFREMVSSEAIVRMNQKTMCMAAFDERERPVVQQIVGSKPDVMAEAARIIEERFRPDAIDINMGCPAHKVITNFDGAALMKDSSLAADIVRSVRDAVRVPVSVKTRLGWSDDTDCITFVQCLERAGADLISIHARTKAQGYAGQANWQRVGDAKAEISIPLLINGDIRTVSDAHLALAQSRADGVLIARGALGNPWFFKELASVFHGGGSFVPPTKEDRIQTALHHADLQIERYGERGLIKLRKHLPYYFKGVKGWKIIRSKLVRINSIDELEAILSLLRYS